MEVVIHNESLWVLVMLCLLALVAYAIEAVWGKTTGRGTLLPKRSNPYKGSSGGSFIIAPASAPTTHPLVVVQQGKGKPPFPLKGHTLFL